MAAQEKRTEVLVGTFVALGLTLLAGLILMFGGLGEIFRATYGIRAIFPSAAGISDQSQVRLGGAKIGHVDGKPELNETFDAVIVELAIYDYVAIPQGSEFRIGTSGLLGDGYVEIVPPAAVTGEILPRDGSANVYGSGPGGLTGISEAATDLSEKAMEILEKVGAALDRVNNSLESINSGILAEENMTSFRESLARLNSAVTKLDENFLSEENIDDIRNAVENVNVASQKIAAAAEEVGPLVEDGRESIAQIGPTLDRFGAAAESFEGAAGKVSGAVDEFQGGDGLAGALMSDEELRREFAALISNLRRHGVLFYRDTAAREGTEPARPDASDGRATSSRRPGVFGR